MSTKTSQIHPTAIVEPGAKIAEGVTIEAYAIVKEHVVLKEGVTIKSHAYIDGHTTIGKDTVIWPFASIGAKTQDLKYRGEITFVEIGERCEIREFVTINASCMENTKVVVGDDCLIMAYCHVAHNCILGHHVIMANNSMLAGHVEVGNYVNIGGMTPVHQYVRIGSHSMVGGFSRVTHDIPPFTIGAGYPYEVGGLNLVGLKRRGFSFEDRIELTKAFKLTYRSNLSVAEAINQLKKEGSHSPHLLEWIEFCAHSKRGLIGTSAVKVAKEDAVEIDEKVLSTPHGV